MLYARKDIPSTCLGVETSLAKVFYTETNLQKKKCFAAPITQAKKQHSISLGKH